MYIISHHPAFNDTVESLKNEFKNDTSNTVIICGAQLLSYTHELEEYTTQYQKVIIFNQEPLLAKQKNMFHENFYRWLASVDEIWDYDISNVNICKCINPNTKLHILKPYKLWPCDSKKDIDVLFYGSLNNHRRNILNQLKRIFKVCILENVFDTNLLDRYILRSRILLNLHYYTETALQEQARMIRWIGAPCHILSEPSKHNYLNVEEVEIHNLTTRIQEILNNE